MTTEDNGAIERIEDVTPEGGMFDRIAFDVLRSPLGIKRVRITIARGSHVIFDSISKDTAQRIFSGCLAALEGP
jgi:hypothetical protein